MRSLAAIITISALLLTAGSGSSTTVAQSAVTFPLTLENCGRSITFGKPAQRVFTIASDSAIAVVAAGAGDRIVARSAEGGAPFGPYQSAVEDKPVISDNATPAAEVVIGTQADVVIAFNSVVETLGPQLRETGINLLVPSWRCGGNAGVNSGTTFESLYDQLTQLGQVFDTSEETAKKVAELRGRQEAVRAKFADRPKRTGAVAYIDSTQLAVYGGPSFATTVLGDLGLSNAFADINNQFSKIGTEDLLGRAPDVIILTYGGSGSTVRTDAEAIERLRAIPGVDTLDVVKSNRILPINFVYVVGSPLTIDGLEQLGNELEKRQ